MAYCKVEVFKIVLVGDCGVGKTNLVSNLIDSPFYEFQPSHISTTDAYHRYHIFQVNEATIKADIWDKAGKRNIDDDPFKFYGGVWGAMVVYDITDCQTYDNAKKWLTVVRKIDDFDVVIVLVGNKSDLQHIRCVSIADASAFANREGIFFIETSALESTNVFEAFHKLLKEIVPVLEKKKRQLLREVDTDDGSSDSDDVVSLQNKSKKKCRCCCKISCGT